MFQPGDNVYTTIVRDAWQAGVGHSSLPRFLAKTAIYLFSYDRPPNPFLFQTTIRKRGYLELKNLPFEEGTVVKISISRRQKGRDLQGLIANDHVWTDEDINAVESGRNIINQWKVS